MLAVCAVLHFGYTICLLSVFSIKTMNSMARVCSPMIVLSIYEGLGLSPALKTN